MAAGKSFILMGVSSTGKTSVGTEVAHRLGIKLIDGDDLHPRVNIIKMGEDHPLNDEDRAPWLERIRDAAFSLEQIPRLEKDGKPDGTYKAISSPKTVYDPIKFSDHEMLEMGQKAVAKGYSDCLG